MTKKNIHVVKRPEGWGTLSEGAQRASKVYPTQKQAEQAAIQSVKSNPGGGEVFVHGENGQFRERNTYGTDPHPPKG
jgi:hypothetical protein